MKYYLIELSTCIGEWETRSHILFKVKDKNYAESAYQKTEQILKESHLYLLQKTHVNKQKCKTRLANRYAISKKRFDILKEYFYEEEL